MQLNKKKKEKESGTCQIFEVNKYNLVEQIIAVTH